MRVSNGGRKPSNLRSRKVASVDSIEKKVNQGKEKINVSTAPKKVEAKEVKEKLEVEKPVEKIETIKTETEKKKVRKPKKPKKVKSLPLKDNLGKLSNKRIVGMVFTGLLSCTLLSGAVYGVYYNQVRYPSQMVEDVESSGLGGINRWLLAINTLDNSSIKSIIGEDSYLAKEVDYTNGDKDRLNFIKKMVGTVSYEPKKVKAKNKYGNPMLERGTDDIVYTDSLVNGVNEELTLHYIDYSKVELDVKKIKEIMKQADLEPGDVDYSNKLIDVFCKYMVSLEDEDIPLVSVKHIPSMVESNGKYSMLKEEDVILDKVLFSSEAFYDFLDDFSVAAMGEENPDWVAWNKLSKKDRKGKEEPDKIKSNLQPTQEWSDWNSKSKEEKRNLEEPEKYDAKKVVSKTWCGSYYLLKEHEVVDSSGVSVKSPVTAELGNGTFKNPAGFNTSIVTYIFVNQEDENGKTKRVAQPIRVKLIDYKVSQDALDYFESKDERNRGYDIKSEVQYASFTFEITNLSDVELTVYDDSSLADKQANMAPRTGTVYGLQDSVTLKPDETGVIESWGSSTELNTKYLVWGSDFKRKKPVVWFRVLAGDLEDTSEDKGVTINKSRFAEDD